MAERFEIRVQVNGPRPPVMEVVEHLWGRNVNLDSDGDSRTADDQEWTELTLEQREGSRERVDVDPVSEQPLVLEVCSSSLQLARRVAEFLRDRTDGHILS